MAFRNYGAPNGRKRIKYDTDDLFGTPDSPPTTPPSSPLHRKKQRPAQTVQMRSMHPSQSSSSPLAVSTASSSPLATTSASPSPPLPPPRNHVRIVAQPIDDDDFTQLPPVMRYMKRKLIGFGSYGRVFKADDQQNNEIVAIKTISLNNDAKLKEVIAFALFLLFGHLRLTFGNLIVWLCPLSLCLSGPEIVLPWNTNPARSTPSKCHQPVECWKVSQQRQQILWNRSGFWILWFWFEQTDQKSTGQIYNGSDQGNYGAIVNGHWIHPSG